MKKILILTAAFGEGHNTAARNIRLAIESADPTARVEVLDLLQIAYGRANQLARAAYLGVVRHAPRIWQVAYHLLDRSPALTSAAVLTRLRLALNHYLAESQPDTVITTYPIYGQILRDLFRDHAELPFRLITVITDSLTIHHSWLRNPSVLYCVTDPDSARILHSQGIPESAVQVTGFPVDPALHRLPESPLPDPIGTHPRRLLFMITHGRRRFRSTLDALLELPHTQLTIVTGRNTRLRSRLHQYLQPHGDRVQILGWTDQMPQLLRSHHLVITKAGGATVHEAIAAQCPLLLHQPIPGQEEGNASLVTQNHWGILVPHRHDIAPTVARIFDHQATLWHQWRHSLAQFDRTHAAHRIARIALEETPCAAHRRPTLVFPSTSTPLSTVTSIASPTPTPTPTPTPALLPSPNQGPLLCDFHIHSTYSDGHLSVPELIDFYGAHGFDCICITDHLADPRRLLGKLSRLTGLTLNPLQLDEYFATIRREADRAWRQYRLLVLPGIEFNKDGCTKKSSAHLLGIDLQHPIAPDLDLPQTISDIHDQNALAVASHPHIMKSEWGKDTLFLWENLDTFLPLLDAWEIANRDNLFSPVSLKRVPFLANSDFHKPRHIYSWKTLLDCPKEPEAIKECIRRNERVSMTYYRPRTLAQPLAQPSPCPQPTSLPFPLPAPVAATACSHA